MRDPGLLERASRVLTAWPAGPGLSEARRRLSAGFPLLVGLTRFDAEALQGRLVETGLMPRLGPAPEGTTPLSKGSPFARVEGRWAAGLGLAVLGAALWAVFGGYGAPKRPATSASAETSSTPPPPPTRETVPPESRMGFSARLVRDGDGRLYLEGTAQVRTFDAQPPAGSLSFSLRAAEDGPALAQEAVPSDGATLDSRISGTSVVNTRTLSFRASVSESGLKGASTLILEAEWGDRRSGPLPLHMPPRP